MLTLLLVAALAQEPADPVEAAPVEEPDVAPVDNPDPEVPGEEVAPEESDAPEGWTRVEDVPKSAEPEDDDPPEGDSEIIVWGEGAVRHAREDIVRSIEDLGYTTLRRKPDGTVVFRPPATWQGRVRLKDGLLEFGRPAVALWLHKPEEETAYDAARTLDGTDTQQTTGLRFVIAPSKRRLAAVEARVLEASRDEVRRYREVVQLTASQDVLYVLPERLDLLWSDGAPLDGGDEPLESFEDRRAHVLEYWSSRADTEQGQAVREAVQAWLSETVQTSEHPLTADEIASAEAAAGRSLPL